MRRWGFAESMMLAAVLTLRDMSKEREQEKKWIKTQNFYQECFSLITENSSKALDVVSRVSNKASACYIPNELTVGCKYLPLYCFYLVINRQGKVTAEQNKLIKLYFEHLDFPFSQYTFQEAAKSGRDIGDFRRIVSISNTFAGEFWVHFFRALYKSGNKQDLQGVVDAANEMIMRFSILGNPNSNLAVEICNSFVNSVNIQLNQVRQISQDEIDWLGIVPIPERLEEMHKLYEELIDYSNVTEAMSKDDLLPLLDLLILNSICDMAMMTKQPKSIKMQMIKEAVERTGLQAIETPESYINHIANNTEAGSFYKQMFSANPPLGSFWQMLAIMGGQTNRTKEALAVTNDLLSILIQVENFFTEKYNFLGVENIAKNYMSHILDQLQEICERG